MSKSNKQPSVELCDACGEPINPSYGTARCKQCGEIKCVEFCCPGGVGTACAICEAVEESE